MTRFFVVLLACFGCVIVIEAASLLDIVKFAVENKDFAELASAPRGRLQTYKYTNCGNASDIANLTELVLSPDPLDFPGPLGVQFKVDIKEDVGTTGLSGDVLMTIKAGSTWVKIPCIGDIGSCHYDDVCSMLAQIQECPPQFVAAGIPCKCPFAKKSYSLPKATFDVGSAVFPPGDIHVVAHLTYQGKPGACADIYATFV